MDLGRDALQKASVPHKKYCGHSFRIGAATIAAARGVEDSDVGPVGELGLFALRTPSEGAAGGLLDPFGFMRWCFFAVDPCCGFFRGT